MQVTLTDTTLRISFGGNLLSTNVEAQRVELFTALDAHPTAQTLVADLSLARQVDSMGVNLLHALYRECLHRELAFRVENPTADVRRLLTVLNLNERFGLTASGLELRAKS